MSHRMVLPVLLGVLAPIVCGCNHSAVSAGIEDDRADLHAAARDFWQSQPIYMRPLADTLPPDGLDAMDSVTCGGCHVDHLSEWRDSIHARAWDDDQFQAEMDKDPSIRWICINCHLPIVDQRQLLPIGLTDGSLRQPILQANPRYSESMRDDAIGCAGCHVREAWIEGPTGEAPAAPHRTRRGSQLVEADFCKQCHAVEARVEELDLVCAFTTGREWDAWVAARPADQRPPCQGCHMPEVIHRRWAGAQPTPGRHHSFPGSLIAKRPQDREAFEALQSIFPEGVEASVSLDPAAPDRGEGAAIVVTLHNTRAGHSVPTGDPERFLDARMTVTDGDGQVLVENVEPIRAKFEWWPSPKLLWDNRLQAGEQREYREVFAVGEAREIVGSVSIDKYRIDAEALEYHHLQDKVVAGRPSVSDEIRSHTR